MTETIHDTPLLLRWNNEARTHGETGTLLATFEQASTTSVAARFEPVAPRVAQAMRTAALEQTGEDHLDRIRAHAAWTARALLLEQWPGEDVPPYIWPIRDLSWRQVVNRQVAASLAIHRALRGVRDDTSDLARDLASAIHSPDSTLAGAAHLIRTASRHRHAEAWTKASGSVGTWWRAWAEPTCRYAAELLGPLVPGAPDAAQIARRLEYAAAVQGMSAVQSATASGISITHMAEWLGVTRPTIYRLQVQNPRARYIETQGTPASAKDTCMACGGHGDLSPAYDRDEQRRGYICSSCETHTLL